MVHRIEKLWGHMIYQNDHHEQADRVIPKTIKFFETEEVFWPKNRFFRPIFRFFACYSVMVHRIQNLWGYMIYQNDRYEKADWVIPKQIKHFETEEVFWPKNRFLQFFACFSVMVHRMEKLWGHMIYQNNSHEEADRVIPKKF